MFKGLSYLTCSGISLKIKTPHQVLCDYRFFYISSKMIVSWILPLRYAMCQNDASEKSVMPE
jgi:hypothetical protein